MTEECVFCPFWRDTETEHGCAAPFPITMCDSYIAKEKEIPNESV